MNLYTVIDLQHRNFERLVDELRKAPGPDERFGVLEELGAELLAHHEAMCRVVFRGIPDHDGLAEAVRNLGEQHEGLTLLLLALRDAEPETRDFADRARDLEESVMEYVRIESREVMPRVRGHVGADQDEAYGRCFTDEKEALLEQGLDPAMA